MQKIRSKQWILGLALMMSGFALALHLAPQFPEQLAFASPAEQASADRERLAELSRHDQLSALFRQVAKTVKPSVVELRVSKKVEVSRRAPFNEELLRRFFGDDLPPMQRPQPPREYFQHGLGSGVIVDAENGHILTNNHVVFGAETIEVRLADGRKFDAEWSRTDPQTDLAVVKIDADDLVETPLGDSEAMQVGDWVLAIGSPRGLPQTVTAGIISAKGRVTGRPNAYENYLQTDAAINRGNSGGPLVNMKGEVIAINNSILSFSGGNEGIGFAIPSNMARRIMTQLIEEGRVTRGFLGVVIQNIDEKLAESFDLPHTRGALVAQVKEDSPAGRAGIREGDFIVRIDGKEVENVNELRNLVAAIEPGRTVSMEILREGETKTLDVTIEAQPEDMAAAFGQRGPEEQLDRYGLEVTTLTAELAEENGYEADTRGALITKVDPTSDAAEQQLRPGMVITQVNRRRVTSAAGLAALLGRDEAENGVRLRVLVPGGGSRYVFITPES